MRPYRRRRRMKREKDNTVLKNVLIVVFCVWLCTALTIIFGNYLKAKVAQSKPDEAQTTEPPTTEVQPTPKEVDTVKVKAFLLDSDTLATGEKSAAQLAETFSYSAVSFELKAEDGSLLYTSKRASDLNQKNSSVLDIKELIEAFKTKGVYTVGCFDAADVYLDTELVLELFDLGINEVIITSLPIDDTTATDSVEYFTELKDALPEGCRLGMSLPCSALFGKDVAALVDKVFLAADFIALDMSELEGEDTRTALDEFIKSYEYYISRYNMRLLLPFSKDQQSEIFDDFAVDNWQIIKQKVKPSQEGALLLYIGE